MAKVSTTDFVKASIKKGVTYAAALGKYENKGGTDIERFEKLWKKYSGKTETPTEEKKSKIKKVSKSDSKIEKPKINLPPLPKQIVFGDKKKATAGFEWLSSMQVAPIYVYIGKGNFLTFTSLEQGFHYFKTHDKAKREVIYNCIKPSDARYHGSEKAGCVMRDDWHEIRETVMAELELAKFSQNLVFRDMLLATKDVPLIECAPWDKEKFWGTGTDLKGGNKKGKGIEKVRSKLRKLIKAGNFDYYTADLKKFY